MKTDYENDYRRYLDIIENYIKDEVGSIAAKGGRATLLEAMKYSLLNGGKRIRPVLSLAVAEVSGVPFDRVLPFACALEMIHAFSLIHDDLPALDNDDFRRGKPSNHKVFGEAMAVICGDALINLAYETMLSHITDKNDLSAAKFVAYCVGLDGMIGGQAIDIIGSDEPDETYLLELDDLKTARLITAAVMIPQLMAGNEKSEFFDFGVNLGILFQFTDDILDVVGNKEELGKTVGKDAEENKVTAVSVFGLDLAKKKAEEYEKKCLAFLQTIDGSEFLRSLVKNVAERRR